MAESAEALDGYCFAWRDFQLTDPIEDSNPCAKEGAECGRVDVGGDTDYGFSSEVTVFCVW